MDGSQREYDDLCMQMVLGGTLIKLNEQLWPDCYYAKSDPSWSGLDFPRERFEELQRVDYASWRREVLEDEELFLDLHDHLPKELVCERELLICRLRGTK